MIPAAYRTSNVVGILATMQTDHDHSRTPILLDALQDAEADEETMRTVLAWNVDREVRIMSNAAGCWKHRCGI